MPRNGSGVYTLPAGNPVVPGTTIDAAWANSTLNDIANELTNSLSRTGAGGMIAPFRIADGNITAPGLSFLNETGSGLYRSGAGSVWMSILGTNTMQFATTAVTVASSRTLNALGNALVGGTLGVTGATTLASTLAVTGALTATGGVLGNITAASGTSTFHDVLINGSLDMAVGSSATITGLSTPTNASDAANKGYVDTQDALRLALTGGTMSGAIAMGANKITGLGTPSADTDAANKAYVDSVAQGLDIKASVRAATTTNISLSGAQTIDGVAVIAGDRVLVKNQSSAADNGIYVASASTWARASDANTWDKLVGAFTFVEDGSTNDNSGWVCAIAPGGTLGVTAVTWEQFSGAGQITAGAGLTKTGNTLNVGTASSARIVVGADEIDLAQTGVSAGTYKSVTVDLFGRVTAGTNPTTLAGYGITDAYTNTQTDTLLNGKLSLTGGTMTGALAMGANRITGMGDPVNAQDAATKNYIDTIFGSTASAAASAAAAASSASAASTSASNASTSASNASSSASAAAASAASAAASYDSFDDRYLGAKSSDPTVDNDGNALITGALYWNTVGNIMKTWTGTAWVSSINPISMPDGTANGVAYLNGSKVLTTGSALTFDGTNLTVPAEVYRTSASSYLRLAGGDAAAAGAFVLAFGQSHATAPGRLSLGTSGTGTMNFDINGSEQARLTSTGLGIGTSSPAAKLMVIGSGGASLYIDSSAGGNNIYDATNHIFRSNSGGSERMRLDSVGNLGIGTSSPFAKLQVVAASADYFNPQLMIGEASNSTGKQLHVGYNTTANTGYIQAVHNGTGYKDLLLQPNGGNLGLGVTPSAWTSATGLQVQNVAVEGRSSLPSYATLSANGYTQAGTWKYISSDFASRYTQYQSQHIWFTAPSGTAGNAISFTQAMTLNASADLLVGTTTTTGGRATISAVANYNDLTTGYSLVLANSPGTGTNSNPVNVGVIQFGNPSATNGDIGRISLVQENPSGSTAGSMRFFTNGGGGNTQTLERARITSGGDLLVGRTSAFAFAASRLAVEHGQPDYVQSIGNSHPSNPFGLAMRYTAAAPNNTSCAYFYADDNSGAQRFSVRSNGGIYNFSANNVNLSDRREKTNFAPAKDYLDTICAIPVQTFNYIDQSEDDPGLTLGVVAQDVQAVAPELVMESNWGTEDNPKMRLSIYQTDLQYALMKALQELKAEFDAYKATHP